jgi:RND superfamily putative drug exporter
LLQVFPLQSKARKTKICSFIKLFSKRIHTMYIINSIPKLRSSAVQALQETNIVSPSSKVWIAGQTATQYNTLITGNCDKNIIILVVILFISILLLAYLRSIVAMIYSVGTVILSYKGIRGICILASKIKKQ